MRQRDSHTARIFSLAKSNLAIPIASFVTFPILAHTLDASGRGEVAQPVALLMLVSVLATVGVPEALQYSSARKGIIAIRTLRSGALTLIIAGLLAGAIVILIAASGYGRRELDLYIVLGLTIVPATLVGLFRGLAAGHQWWRLVNAERYITALSRLAILVILLISGTLTVRTAVITIAASPLIGGLAYLALLPKRHQIASPDVRVDAIAPYARSVWIGSISGILLLRADQAVMGPLTSSVELGLYATAVNIADVLALISNAARDVTVSADARENKDERASMTSRIAIVLTLALAVVVACTSPLWLPILFGVEFLQSIPAMLMLLAAAVVNVPASISGAVLSARNRPGRRSAALVLATCISVGVLVLLVGPYGSFGAGIATLAGTIVLAVVNLASVRQLFGFPVHRMLFLTLEDIRFAAHSIRFQRADPRRKT